MVSGRGAIGAAPVPRSGEYPIGLGLSAASGYTRHDMPIYEFRCNGCGTKLSLFFRSMRSEAEGVCDRCGSIDLQRLFSSFRVLRTPFNPASVSKAELLDGVNYTDPGSMASFFRRMQDTFQDGPDEHMDEVVERLDHGEAVEKALDLDMHGPEEGRPADEG